MEWASRYLVRLSKDFEKTAYEGIFKLRGGHCLTVNRDRHNLSRYNSPFPGSAPHICRQTVCGCSEHVGFMVEKDKARKLTAHAWLMAGDITVTDGTGNDRLTRVTFFR